MFYKFIFLLLLSLGLHAQVTKDSALFKELEKQDSIFFNKSFNNCDIEFLEKAISNNLKFYHDQSGFQNRTVFLENVKTNLCSNFDKKPIRKLVPGTLEVFPLFNEGVLYGAIQNGIHEFYIREPNKKDVKTGSAKFTSVWIKEGNAWLLETVLSYDHMSAQ